jgi:hypothetical protein
MEAIKPTYVTFEQAQKLKQMDFNIPCQYLYVDGEYRISFEEKGELFDNKYPSTQKPIDWCLAPEQWQVVEFLRIKYGIWGYVEKGKNPENYYFVIDIDKKSTLRKENVIISFKHKPDMWANTPQEACSKGIDYILENILP